MRRTATLALAVCFSLTFASASAAAQGVDVPLSKFTNLDFPNGFDFGAATGVSFGDFDHDGWPDLFAYDSGQLWRNVEGRTWVLVTDVDSILPPAGLRYGSAFGDYDNDGLPDLSVDPRRGFNDECFHLLKNLGGGRFFDIAPHPQLLDFQPCAADSETSIWADVDGDGDLDLFLPIYPSSGGGGNLGNKFFHNRGPTGPGGLYRFTEESIPAGLVAPTGNARPEGTWFLDSDGDGDLELYSNGALYRNLSSLDSPLFEAMDKASTGIGRATTVDEGVFFTDYDMDGDFDLLISYTLTAGLRLWESRGDGSFFAADTSLIEDYRNGATFGLSAADWDQDGDIDFQALTTFRKNLAMEGGRGFLLATHNVDPAELQGSTIAWGDWDDDGDPDALIGGHPTGDFLWRNDSYSAQSPPEARRDVRVRVVRDAPGIPTGLETEYGATVEVRVRGEDPLRRRRQIVSSAAGYLTQNEYALAFALPADPAPADPDEDVRFDVSVDFPSLPAQGFHRVNEFVNPALAGLDLASLYGDRELSVFRSGAVRLHGIRLEPRPTRDPTLDTTPIARPALGAPLATPQDTNDIWAFVGMEIDTSAATAPLQIEEVILDALPGAPFSAPGGSASGNLLLWDVTTTGNPVLVPHGVATLALDPRNDRGSFPVDFELAPGRRYRLVARIDRFRATPISSPPQFPSFSIPGGMRYHDATPWTGQGAETATLDPANAYLAIRVSREPRPDWVDLGAAHPGAAGSPRLSASGDPLAGARVTLSLTGAPPSAGVVLAIGSSVRCAHLGRVPIVPEPETLVRGLFTDANGDLSVTGIWPTRLERDQPLFVQAFVVDPSAAGGVAASNALAGLSRN